MSLSAVPQKNVAILVPASDRDVLTSDEEISLRHLHCHLAAYDKFLIVPRGSQLRVNGLKPAEFSRKYFGSMEAHCRLLSSPAFYKQFAEYKYILIYHLDALVFRDDLANWCETDIDYIGAPWICCADTPWVTQPRVGNGGFALMKVESVLKVLRARYRKEPANRWKDFWEQNKSFFHGAKRTLGRFLPHNTVTVQKFWREITRTELSDLNNDLFWSDHAVKYVPEFKVASLEDGLRFAFEASPRICFELNGKNLPFGCHAWAKYDRAFWEPHILK